MDLQILLSTMHQNDVSIYDKMNIKSNAVIINQCNENRYEETIRNNKLIKMYSFSEKGVGRSRNNALMRSNSDICLIADDDMIYVDNYEEIVINAFNNNPKADMIIFNVRIHNSEGIREKVKRNQRIRFYNCLRYGAVTFAFKRKKILKSNIFFSLMFGGGAKYGSGEDSLFMWDCIKKGLRIYSDKSVIADVYNYSSTWFKGYTEKYFWDKGALYAAISPRLFPIFILQYAYRKKSLYESQMSIGQAIKLMLEGAKEYKNN